MGEPIKIPNKCMVCGETVLPMHARVHRGSETENGAYTNKHLSRYKAKIPEMIVHAVCCVCYQDGNYCHRHKLEWGSVNAVDFGLIFTKYLASITLIAGGIILYYLLREQEYMVRSIILLVALAIATVMWMREDRNWITIIPKKERKKTPKEKEKK